MRLSEVRGLAEWLPNCAVSGDSFWNKTASSLSTADITLFYARCGLMGKRQEAIDAVERAQTACITALFRGDLPQGSFADLVLHEPPPSPYLVDEFIDGLIKMRPSRRPATVFALEARMQPAEVANLTWKDVGQSAKLAPVCLEAIKMAQATRHVRLPYVFWEWVSTSIAAPLVELQHTIETAFDCGYMELQARYNRMTAIDRRADQTSFLQLVEQVRKG